MNKQILKTIFLEKDTNAFSIECTDTSKIYIRRKVDGKIFEEDIDFEVINNGRLCKIIIFNNTIDTPSEYEIYIEVTDRA